jgi:hypothetical protein
MSSPRRPHLQKIASRASRQTFDIMPNPKQRWLSRHLLWCLFSIGIIGFGISSVLAITHVGPIARFILALLSSLAVSTVQKYVVQEIHVHLLKTNKHCLAVIFESILR